MIGVSREAFMRTDYGSVQFVGYESQHVDFLPVYQDSNYTAQDLRDKLDSMIEAAVTAESGLVPGAYFSLLVVGHADRVDIAGWTSEQKRELELTNSEKRAEDAEAYFFNEMVARLTAQGFEAPASAQLLGTVQTRRVACGSAQLFFPNPGNDEGQRRANRRVEFFGAAFSP